MVLLLVALGAGLLAGRLRAPAGAHALRMQLRWLWLLGAGAVLGAVAASTNGDAAVLAQASSLVVLLAFVLANPQVTGIAVIGVGLLLNLTALVLNGGMPVRGDALVAAGAADRQDLPTLELRGPRHLEHPGDTVPVLGDVLPVGIAREAMSFGDLIVVVGLADATRDLARRRQRRWDDNERAGYAALTTLASVDHDWGTAPSGAPVSATQCSANPERDAPVTIDLAKEAAAASSPDLVAANHTR